MTEEEWGPWIEHDGKGYPPEVIGRVCKVKHFCPVVGMTICGPFTCIGKWEDGGSWNWDNYPKATKVIRYRVRKPKGMKILEGILRDVKEGVDA